MSKMRILQIAHDHPDWTSGGTEILAHRLTRDLDARDDFGARFLAAATSLQRPDVAPGALAAQGARRRRDGGTPGTGVRSGCHRAHVP